MFKFRNCLVGGSLILAAALSSTSAMAGTVIGTLNSVGSGDTITLHAVRPDGSTIGQQVLNGVATFTRTGGTDTATLVGAVPGSFLAFCVEPFEDASLNTSYTYNTATLANADTSSLTGGLGATKATQISELLGKYAPNLSASMTQVQASAIQVAIWEIVSELSTNPFDVTHGNTTFTTGSADSADVLDLAQTYLNYVTSANGNGPQAQGLEALTVSGHQDFLVQIVGTAPEPSTWAMMLIGFGLIGRAMRAARDSRGKLSPGALKVSVAAAS